MPDQPVVAQAAAFVALAAGFLVSIHLLAVLAKRYRERFTELVDYELARMHLFVDARRLLALHVVLVVSSACVAFVLTTRAWLAAAIIAIGLFLPRLVLMVVVKRRRERFRRQLPDMMAMVAAGLRAGLGLSATVADAADRLPAPIRDELRLVERERRLGATFDQALANLERRVAVEETQVFVNTLRLGAQAGSSLAASLDAQALMLRRRLLLEGKVRALTAQARLQAWIMGALPFIVLVAMLVIDRSLVALYFDTVQGRIVLLIVLALQLAGGWSIIRMATIRI